MYRKNVTNNKKYKDILPFWSLLSAYKIFIKSMPH